MTLLRERDTLRDALARLYAGALAQQGECLFSGDHPIAQAAAALAGVTTIPPVAQRPDPNQPSAHQVGQGEAAPKERQVSNLGQSEASSTSAACVLASRLEICAGAVEHQKEVAANMRCQRNDLRAFLEHWTHDGHLQTFEDRERFRKAARALLDDPLGTHGVALPDGGNGNG